MKKRIKDVIIGFVIGCLLMTTTPVLANTIIEKIDVVLNGVNVNVNGQKLDSNSILYNGSTYLPLRKVAKAVGKDVEWNQNTMTANIVDDETKTINNEMSGNVEEFLIIQVNENGIPIISENNGETYYTLKYMFELMKTYNEYTFNNKNGDISIVLFEDNSSLINNIQYSENKGVIWVSKSYYENTILPLIK